MKNQIKYVFFIGMVGLTLPMAKAQNTQLETEKGIVASIAPYDPEIRQSILLASQNPAILLKIEQRQEQTQASFQKMIGGFRQKKQAWFYEISRYPDFMNKLATTASGQNKAFIYSILPNQSSELKEAAWKLYKHEKSDLAMVNKIQSDAQEAFVNDIQSLDGPNREAFKKLAEMPDVLTLLTKNIELTTKLGQQFLNDPTKINNSMAAIHDSLNVQNQYEMAAFKKEIEDNPKALQEMTKAEKEYARANGYNVPNQQYYGANYPYFANPYSFWFGYPMWYNSPMWYPGAFGFNAGFGFGLGGYGLYGFPTFGFSNWFFGGGYYNRYPILYRHFGNYYRGQMGSHRIVGSVNSGFMAAAHNHFNASGGRLNFLNNANTYSRPTGNYNQLRLNNARSSAYTYHAQSWGNNGGGFRGGYAGSGFRTYSGGHFGRH